MRLRPKDLKKSSYEHFFISIIKIKHIFSCLFNPYNNLSVKTNYGFTSLFVFYKSYLHLGVLLVVTLRLPGNQLQVMMKIVN